jgi:hypothetical protein
MQEKWSVMVYNIPPSGSNFLSSETRQALFLIMTRKCEPFGRIVPYHNIVEVQYSVQKDLHVELWKHVLLDYLRCKILIEIRLYNYKAKNYNCTILLIIQSGLGCQLYCTSVQLHVWTTAHLNNLTWKTHTHIYIYIYTHMYMRYLQSVSNTVELWYHKLR